jgi:hypothetical protein
VNAEPEPVRLDRKCSSGRLDPESARNPAQLRRETLLTFPCRHVLDYRVREGNVCGAVGEREGRPVAKDNEISQMTCVRTLLFVKLKVYVDNTYARSAFIAPGPRQSPDVNDPGVRREPERAAQQGDPTAAKVYEAQDDPVEIHFPPASRRR